MSKERIISVTTSIVLVILILIFVFFNGIVLVSGPARAPEMATMNTIKLYEQKHDVPVDEVLNRFSFKEVYTLVKVDDEILVLLADGTVVYRHPFVTIPSHLQSQNASYGYYKDKLVFVTNVNNRESFYDSETSEQVFTLEMGD